MCHHCMFTITGKDISEKDFVDLHNYIFTKGDALYRINYTGCLLVNIEVIRKPEMTKKTSTPTNPPLNVENPA